MKRFLLPGVAVVQARTETGSLARLNGPPVYRPGAPEQVAQRQMSAGAGAPPVYRPSATVGPLQRAMDVRAAAPAVYRPAAIAVAARPPVYHVPVGGRSGAGGAPPVYRPGVQHGAVLAKNVTGSQRIASPPAVYRPAPVKVSALPARPGAAATVQGVIVKGKTTRSKPYQVLRSSAWYGGLPSDQHKAWAVALHEVDTLYTEETALTKIEEKIKAGLVAPAVESDAKKAKAERLRKVTAHVNANAPKTDSTAYQEGYAMNTNVAKAHERVQIKVKGTTKYKGSLSAINKVKPNLFADQEMILEDEKPFVTMTALMTSTPSSYDYNLDGVKAQFDGKTKAKATRSGKYSKKAHNLNQLFLEQKDGDNSYWKQADKGGSASGTTAGEMLDTLELARNPRSTLTTVVKRFLHEEGDMTAEQAYGDMDHFTFMEYKGALSPTSNMAAMQEASSYHTMNFALGTAPDTPIGTRTKGKKTASVRSMTTAAKKRKADYSLETDKAEVKEYTRMIIGRFGLNDINSDTEDEENWDKSRYPKKKKLKTK
jgi:hypothetical protein